MTPEPPFRDLFMMTIRGLYNRLLREREQAKEEHNKRIDEILKKLGIRG